MASDTAAAQEPVQVLQPAPSERPSRVVAGNWGISIALVIVMLGATASLVTITGNANARTATLEAKIEGTSKALESKIDGAVDTLKELRTLVGELASATQKDISALQRENADLRERMTREVGELRLQIAEVRAAMLQTSR